MNKVMLARMRSVSQFWGMDMSYLLGLIDSAQASGPFDFDMEDGFDEAPYTLVDDIACLSVEGPMVRAASFFTWLFGGTSTQSQRMALRMAVNDPSVRGIFYDFHTPGGEVAGTLDFYQDMRAANAIKPVHAYSADLMASCGQWAASGAGKVSVGPLCNGGCVGTVLTLCDSHKAAEEAGIEIVVFGSGDMKGAGTPGTEITPEMRAYFSGLVGKMTDGFVGCIAEGRNIPLEKARALANGRIYVGPELVENGLADVVCSYDEAFAALCDAAPKRAATMFPIGANNGGQDSANGFAGTWNKGNTTLRIIGGTARFPNLLATASEKTMNLPFMKPKAQTAPPAGNPEDLSLVITGGENNAHQIAVTDSSGQFTRGAHDLLHGLAAQSVTDVVALAALVRQAADGREARQNANAAMEAQMVRLNGAEAVEGKNRTAAYSGFTLGEMSAHTELLKTQADGKLGATNGTDGKPVAKPGERSTQPPADVSKVVATAAVAAGQDPDAVGDDYISQFIQTGKTPAALKPEAQEAN